MANIKFSQFTQKTTLGTVDFLVGYTGADNVQIDPADLLSDYSQGTGAAGQVTFFSAASTVTGDNNLYWDNTNKRLGIGTVSPQSRLHITDDVLSILKIQETTGNTGASAGVLFKTSPNTGPNFFKGGILYEDTGDANIIGKLHLVNRVSADTINANTGDAKLTIDTSGNVGIGTTSPSAKLEVDGTLIATGISQLGSSGANVLLTSSSAGNVGIGTSNPSAKLHTKIGTSGGSSYSADVGIFAEGGSRSIIQMSSINDAYLMFGDAAQGNRAWLGYQHSNDQLSLHTSSTITMDGDVGIGTSGPSKKLEVVSNTTYDGIQISGSSIPTLGIIDTTNNAKFVAYVRDSDATIGTETNHPLTINTNNIERMRIDSAGNVGIGTTSPGAKLEVKGATAENTQIRIQTDGGASEVPTLLLRRSSIAYGEIKYIPDGGGNQGVHITDYRTDVSNIIFNTAGTNERMRIDTSGNVGIGTTNPETLAHIKVNGGSAQLTLEREGGGAGKAVLAGAAGGLIVYNDAFATKMYVGTSGSYDGNVGIGTISPQYKLDVDGDVQINETLIAKAGADLILQARSSQIVGINSNGTRTMTLDASNNVGIGTSSPASKLEVDGGDIEVDDSASGLILRSPDGTRYRVTVANGGTLSVSAV